MKRYAIALVSITIALVVAAFCTLWFGNGLFQVVMAFLPLYFAIITGFQHRIIVKSFYKDPRTFVKNFLAVTVGSLFLHLAVICIWALTHMRQAQVFIIAFCICYLTYLVFETIALIMLVRRKQREQQAEQDLLGK